MAFIRQHRGIHRPGALRLALGDDGRQRGADIQDIVHDQHAAILDGQTRPRDPVQLAALGLALIAGGMEVIDLQGKMQASQQMPRRDDTPGHDTEHQRQLVAHSRADLARHGIQRGLYLRLIV